MTRLVLAAAMLVVMVASTLALCAGSGRAQPVTIDAGNNYFCAPTFEDSVCETTVTVGSTVTWQVSGGIHTVTQCDASFSACPPGGGFDSGLLNSGGTFAHTFNTPGTIPYYLLVPS